MALAESVDERIDAETHLPVALRDAAATATRRVLEQHLEESAGPGRSSLAERARLLNNLSIRLADLGRREEALSAIEESVECSAISPARVRRPSVRTWR